MHLRQIVAQTGYGLTRKAVGVAREPALGGVAFAILFLLAVNQSELLDFWDCAIIPRGQCYASVLVHQ